MAGSFLQVRLLGEFDVREGNTVLPLAASARAQSFIAYLLMHQETVQSRQHLAFLLWPDSTEAQARTNLRHVLHNVRLALPEPDRFLEVSARALRWKSDAPCWLDVSAFERSIEKAEKEGNTDAGLKSLREAVALYTGDLLDGCYDEWLLALRERLRQRYLGTLERLTSLLTDRGEHVEAVGYTQQLLRADPLQEGSYRSLMRLHAAAGDRARAVHVYHTCVTTLERELGVAPSSTTARAYEMLMAPAAGAPAAPAQPERIGGQVLVGRGAELARLQAIWRDTQEGKAQMVLVSGEPGVGKTRLVEALAEWCARQGGLVARARSYAAEGTLAYGLMIGWLRTEGLGRTLSRLPRPVQGELAQVIPELEVERLDVSSPRPQSASEQRRRLFEAATRAVLAPMQPVLLVADDIHWGDVDTVQFLHYLLRVEPTARLMVAATARREALLDHLSLGQLRAGLQLMDRYAEIELDRLTRDETAALAAQLVGRALDPLRADQLHADTEGNALFVVETLRAGWDQDAAPGSTQGLAPKLQAVIRSRLAQLSGPARDVVGVAATIGREFGLDVLGGACDGDSQTFVTALDELWRRGIVREQGADDYDFSHDKIREVAYTELSAARRRHHHLRVAETLLRFHGPEAAGVRGQIAAHFENAGQLDDAVTWYVRASGAAQAVHAYSEAVRLLDRALSVLSRLPQDAERTERVVAILSSIPALIAVVEGFTSPRLTEAQERALERARAFGVEPAPALLRSLAMTSLTRRDFDNARRTGALLVARGECDADEPLIVEGNYVLGVTAFWVGELHAARHHFEAALHIYRGAERSSYFARFGHDPKVVCLGRLACTLLFLGYPKAARAGLDETLSLARTIDHPFSLGLALLFGALLSLELRELERFGDLVAEMNALPAEYQPLPNLVARSALAGLVWVHDGRVEDGIARIETALQSVQDLDPAPGMRTMLLRLLLAAHADMRDPAAGLAAADRALALSGTRIWTPEMRRLRAEFLRALGRPSDEVDAELGLALDVGREQGSALFVLRTAASLARHRIASGDPGRAQALAQLAAALRTIPEASDLSDGRDATNLLRHS